MFKQNLACRVRDEQRLALMNTDYEFFLMKIEVEEWISHPNYVLGKNDIGLLRLSRPAAIHESVVPVCLPLNPERVAQQMNVRDLAEGLDGVEGIIIGWGRTEFDNFGEALVSRVNPSSNGLRMNHAT